MLCLNIYTGVYVIKYKLNCLHAQEKATNNKLGEVVVTSQSPFSISKCHSGL